MVTQLELSAPIDQGHLVLAIPAADPSARVPASTLLARPDLGGAVLPGTQSVVNVVTWNTSNQSLRETANTGHAEHQLVNWLEGKGEKFMSTINGITVNVNPYSPCSACSDELVYVLNLIKKTRTGQPVAANLSWSEIYPGARGGVQATTSQSLVELQRAGWVLSGGEVPQDESVYKHMVHVAPLE